MSKFSSIQKQEGNAHLSKMPTNHTFTKLPTHSVEQPGISVLQNCLGNTVVQRLLAQRRGGDGAFDLDDATAERINRARGNGQPLDGAVQTRMSEAIGADFSGVRVHMGSEAHQLNEQLQAKAFTTGQDIFFREGEYNPHNSSGQTLLAHELTHVVQQASGAVGGGSTMRVNAPSDHFEQQADAVAKQATSGATAPSVQRAMPTEDSVLQQNAIPKPEEQEVPPDLMGKWEPVQRQEEQDLIPPTEMPIEEPEAK